MSRAAEVWLDGGRSPGDGGAPSADLLAAIVAGTRRSVEVRQEREPLAALARRASALPARLVRFDGVLRAAEHVNIIAECKRRSPSKGVLRGDYDPVALARAYADAGAAAISVLTEPSFFDGALEHLQAIREVVDVPILRKDFLVTEYQLLEARAAGADAVLLIAAALRPVELKVLHDHAVGLDLDVLVEVHDANELAVAVDAGARLIGVNNRNLRTLGIDARISEELIASIPPDVVAVSESGLQSAQEIDKLRKLGYRAFLIGERFMTAPDPGAALRSLLEACGGSRPPRPAPALRAVGPE